MLASLVLLVCAGLAAAFAASVDDRSGSLTTEALCGIAGASRNRQESKDGLA